MAKRFIKPLLTESVKRSVKLTKLVFVHLFFYVLVF